MTSINEPSRDVLNIPVAQATPEQIAQQAHLHATDAARIELPEFLEDIETIEHQGELTIIGRIEGFNLMSNSEVALVLPLYRIAGRQIVRFRSYPEQGADIDSYGVMNIEHLGQTPIITQYSIDQLFREFGSSVCIRMMGALKSEQLATEMAAAQERLKQSYNDD